jgi:polyisoprenoid-binding protein YceI
LRDDPLTKPASLGVQDIALTAQNTSVSFSVRWLGVLTVRGSFSQISGVVRIPDGDLARVSVRAEVGLESVRTGIGLRDRHLRGGDFFEVSRHPVATFRGGSSMRWPTHVTLPGSLTIRGHTCTEELACEIQDPRIDGRPTSCVTIRATAHVDRRAFGIGVVHGLRRLDPLFHLIGDEVVIEIGVRVEREFLSL